MGNNVMEDFRGNKSFTRWAVLGLLILGVGSAWAAVHWAQAKDVLLHAFDKMLDTAVLLFFGGKAPETFAQVKGWLAKFSGKPEAPKEEGSPDGTQTLSGV